MQFACPSQNITNCLHCDPTAGLNNRDGKKKEEKRQEYFKLIVS